MVGNYPPKGNSKKAAMCLFPLPVSMTLFPFSA